METIGDIAQAVMVTSAAILTGRALVKGIFEEYAEIITFFRERTQWMR